MFLVPSKRLQHELTRPFKMQDAHTYLHIIFVEFLCHGHPQNPLFDSAAPLNVNGTLSVRCANTQTSLLRPPELCPQKDCQQLDRPGQEHEDTWNNVCLSFVRFFCAIF